MLDQMVWPDWHQLGFKIKKGSFVCLWVCGGGWGGGGGGVERYTSTSTHLIVGFVLETSVFINCRKFV